MFTLLFCLNRRGASGGLIFAKALGLSLDLGGSAVGRKSLPVSKALPALVIPPRFDSINSCVCVCFIFVEIVGDRHWILERRLVFSFYFCLLNM